ncbi:carboxy terminal-processing peptidase [Luteimonas sp. e5]
MARGLWLPPEPVEPSPLLASLQAPPVEAAPARDAAGKSTPTAFATTREQAETSALVHGLLSESRYAYRPRTLDAALGADVWKRYLESLDPSKMYLTRSDVEAMGDASQQAMNAVRGGDFAPMYAVFETYLKRVRERSEYSRALLKQDIFDFSADDRFAYDRKDAPWADAAELDALWRQSVRSDWLRLKLAGRSADEIRGTLDKRYANVVKMMGDYNAEDVFQIALNAYTGAIDPHTGYFNPRAAERFNQAMSLSLEGIGAQLQKREDIVTIMELIPGGPAARDGQLKPGDRIIGVGQGRDGVMEDVVGWRIDDVVAKIKGPKGTVVRLDVLPVEAAMDAAPQRIVLTRDKVVIAESRAKRELIELPAAQEGQPARRIGVIKLPSFYQDFGARRSRNADYVSSSADVARLLGELREEGVDGVLLDLRNNGGGSLDEAVRITGLFIDQGPVVQERQAGGRINVRRDRDPGVTWDGPLAVLINRTSASASEIVAGAIQDYGRGLIIGETSFGKGTVQAMVDLDRVVPGRDGKRYGEVKLTIAEFFRPGGASTQNRGVSPDIAFPSTMDEDEFGESTFDNALPWSKIDPVEHVAYGHFSNVLPQLERMHQARVADDVEYQWRLQDAEESRVQRARKWISLSESERRAEREKDEAKRKFRQAERERLGLALDPLADERADDGLQSIERDVVRQAEREKLAEKVPDPLLHEAAAILGDAARLLDEDRGLAAKVLPQSSGPGRWAD